MADKRDYYEVLGVSKDADDSALKKAYRQLAKKYHPDANPGDATAEAKFKEASEAYAVLSDPDKRAKYDQFGHAAFEQGGGGSAYDFNMDDFSSIFGGFGDIFGSMFGGGTRRNSNGPMKGQDVGVSVRITFDESITGVDKEIEIVLKEECETCKGSGAKPGTSKDTCSKCGGKGQIVYTTQSLFGMVRNVQTCPTCGGSGKVIKEKCADCYGTGYVSKKKKISVRIPAGISSGNRIRISGKGEPGKNGGPRGDLIITVMVSSHPTFERQDYHIFSETKISFVTAALGGEIRIKTVDGEVAYDVEPGTQSHTRVRLRGKGVPYNDEKKARGDHYVTLIVEVPKKLNSEQKEALKDFGEAMDGKRPEGSKKKKGFFK